MAARPADTTTGRRSRGPADVHHARSGGAPSVAAASTGPGPMLSSAGTTVRTTRGSATSAWPMGTSHHEARQSNGGVSKVISSPSPTVTADVASGSIRPASSSQPWRWATATATAASVPDDDRQQRGESHRLDRHPQRLQRVDAEADPGSHLAAAEVAPRGERVAVAGAQRAQHEAHQGRRHHHHRRRGDDAARNGAGGRGRRDRPLFTGPGVERQRGPPPVPATQDDERADEHELQQGERRPPRRDRRTGSPDATPRPRSSSGVVHRAGARRRSDVNVKTNTIAGGRGELERRQRQDDVYEGVPRRSAERGRRGLQIVGERSHTHRPCAPPPRG